MKLEWLRADIASARRATTYLAALLTASLLVNVVLALLTMRMSGRERKLPSGSRNSVVR